MAFLKWMASSQFNLEVSTMKKLAILALVLLLPVAANAATVTKEGDPGFLWGFDDYGAVAAHVEMIKGETGCFELAPLNFGFQAASTCQALDTFCVVLWDELGWTIGNPWVGDWNEGPGPFELNKGYYWPDDACITVPCSVTVGTTNIFYAAMCYSDVELVCQPDSGDCVPEPNVYGGAPCYMLDTLWIEIVESPPALSILQDTLYYVEQGVTSGYIPFAICNGDPCAPPTDYGYTITSKGHVGLALNINAVIVGIPGGECGDVYGIVDAGDAEVCDYDTLTIIAWDNATGTVYDTCVQAIHVIEPVPVPLFTAPVVTILVLAMILAAAVIMKRHAVSKA
jgi:hypothetical protein